MDRNATLSPPPVRKVDLVQAMFSRALAEMHRTREPIKSSEMEVQPAAPDPFLGAAVNSNEGKRKVAAGGLNWVPPHLRDVVSKQEEMEIGKAQQQAQMVEAKVAPFENLKEIVASRKHLPPHLRMATTPALPQNKEVAGDSNKPIAVSAPVATTLSGITAGNGTGFETGFSGFLTPNAGPSANAGFANKPVSTVPNPTGAPAAAIGSIPPKRPLVGLTVGNGTGVTPTVGANANIGSTNGTPVVATAPLIASNVNTKGMIFTAWPTAEVRGRAPSQKRSVLLRNLSPRARLSDLTAICKNTGVIERFEILGSGRAAVYFVDQTTADAFLARTANGVTYKNTCIFVEPHNQVDVLSGRLREAMEKGARRIIRIVGIVDAQQLKDAYKELVGGSVEHLKGLDETAILRILANQISSPLHVESAMVKRNSGGFLEGRVVWGKTDIALKAFPVLRKSDILEGCNIQFGDDPCDTISLTNPAAARP
ncbi:hypothetical protein FN846DRAFT_914109 [Sphaerosporella brunnea]|uniref:RRM domain-containing protein n=1 Tax=Sphaerosporella brunnea TaxID=1250544 RepID=A0A5J5EDL7_9PEZI|nr:hypothetical protein FN846DRAFT_914109 [Sphaerosporella brunnea]